MTLLPREGLTIEAIFSLFQGTIFNPFFTGPLHAVLLYFPQQVQSVLPRSMRHYVTTKIFLWTLRVLVGYSVLRTLNNYLSRRVLNNWARDSWRHGKEIVLVTGGGGGIGEAVARGLSASSAHVIAVDIIPPKKPFRKSPEPRINHSLLLKSSSIKRPLPQARYH
jgi:all-trans-retinol dehydrogenase (NAD+)